MSTTALKNLANPFNGKIEITIEEGRTGAIVNFLSPDQKADDPYFYRHFFSKGESIMIGFS